MEFSDDQLRAARQAAEALRRLQNSGAVDALRSMNEYWLEHREQIRRAIEDASAAVRLGGPDRIVLPPDFALEARQTLAETVAAWNSLGLEQRRQLAAGLPRLVDYAETLRGYTIPAVEEIRAVLLRAQEATAQFELAPAESAAVGQAAEEALTDFEQTRAEDAATLREEVAFLAASMNEAERASVRDGLIYLALEALVYCYALVQRSPEAGLTCMLIVLHLYFLEAEVQRTIDRIEREQ